MSYMTAGWTSWEFGGDCRQPFEGGTLQGQQYTSEISYKVEMTEKHITKSSHLCTDITKIELKNSRKNNCGWVVYLWGD